MKEARPRPQTIEKYKLYIKSLLIKAGRSDFNAQEFVKKGHLPNHFIRMCEQLRYIQKCGGRWMPVFLPENVTRTDGWLLAKTSLEYNIKHSERYSKGNYKIVDQSKVHVTEEGELKENKTFFSLNLFGWKISLVKR